MFSEQIKAITQKVEDEFGKLNDIQLNWKPSKEAWSIGQCFDHIIKSNEQYLNKLKVVILPQFKQTFWERYNPLTKYTGKKMILSLGEVVTKKYKNPLIFTPSKNIFSAKLIPSFFNHNESLQNVFIQIEEGNRLEFVITSPVASLVTLKVKDVLELIIVHEKRHINQAMKVKMNETFPL